MQSKTTMLGLDFGASALKWTLMERGSVKQAQELPLPENLTRDSHIGSVQMMGDTLRDSIRKNRVGRKPCAVVLPAENVIVRHLTMPYMTVDQLVLNLPYEFHDFIKDEKENYFFDYAVVGVHKDENNSPTELELLAAAVRRDVIARCRQTLHRAGLKLERAVPACIAYGNLLRAYETLAPQPDHPAEYCIADMGHQSIRLYFYRGSVFETSRIIEYGGQALDALIADAAAVDPHIAASYKRANYSEVQDIPACRDLYNRVAVEIMRAVNFYGFNTPNSDLQDIYFTGGLARLTAMTQEITNTLSLNVHQLDELMPDSLAGPHTVDSCPVILGALLQGDGK